MCLERLDLGMRDGFCGREEREKVEVKQAVWRNPYGYIISFHTHQQESSPL
jgi:hypothetical protein